MLGFDSNGRPLQLRPNHVSLTMYGPGIHAPGWEFTSRTVAQCTSEEVTAAIVHCLQGYAAFNTSKILSTSSSVL
jgi:hypothetical protein